jgi:heat shock protein HtpX
VADDPALNAFATGMNQKQYAITVTSGLIARLNDAELESVLGHELTHIRNGDVRMLVVAVIIAGAVAFFAELFFRLWFNAGGSFGSRRSRDDDRGRGGNVIAIVIAVGLVAVAWLMSGLIRFALSRSREYLADAGAVELTKNPDAMISALRKIEARGELAGATSAVMEMCIDNPREEFTDLFSTHPSVDARVKALVELMGGHDPGPLALPGPDDQQAEQDGTAAQNTLPGQMPEGPWGDAPGGANASLPSEAPSPGQPWGAPSEPAPAQRPFLPDRPPIDLRPQQPAPPSGGSGPADPWGRPGGRG